jgi:hypothetical protein
MNFGEFILAFTNPDCEGYDNKHINLKEALEIFENDIIVKANLT